MRGAFQKLLPAGHSRETVLNLLAAILSEPGRSGSRHPIQLLDVEAKCLRRRHSARRGMRLIEQAGISQRSHYIANRRRTHALAIAQLVGDRLRGDRLPGIDIRLDNGGKHRPLPWTDPDLGGHSLSLNPLKYRLFRRYFG